MKKTFRYNALMRWFGFFFLIMGSVPPAYIFFRAFVQFRDIISSSVWLVIFLGFIGIGIYFWNYLFLKITVDGNCIRIKKPLKTITVNWSDIIEYGREEHAYSDKYYVKTSCLKNKTIYLFNDRLKDLKIVNAYILSQTKAAKNKNIPLAGSGETDRFFSEHDKKLLIAVLACSVIIIFNYYGYNKKKALYNEGMAIEQELSKYERIIAETKKVRYKYNALKNKNLNDEALIKAFEDAKQFLDMAEKVEGRHSQLVQNYNQICKQYNIGINRLLFFHGSLPKVLNPKTQRVDN